MTENHITAVILAGGRGSRLGGQDKGLKQLAGHHLVEYLIQALEPQVDEIIISANRHRAEYARFGLPVLGDTCPGFQGPLAGILTALEYSRSPCLLSVPCDAPLLADDYARRMLATLEQSRARACVAECHGRWQSVHCLLHREVRADAEQAIRHQRLAMNQWLQSIDAVSVDMSDHPEQFENINNQADLERLEQLLERRLGTA